MYDYYQVITLILTAIYLLIGGGFIIYIYDSYKKTKQTFLLHLSAGFFFLIVQLFQFSAIQQRCLKVEQLSLQFYCRYWDRQQSTIFYRL